ncbi:MAG: hypothetical protein KDA63_07300, partial [Planctomycetales bacterium]|nr:hypothetical protein [Planctomycetales bacterium]
TGTNLLPRVETQRVQNHSWIIPSGGSSTILATEVQRRFDYMLDRDNVVAAVGVNNRSDSVFPLAMANSYNSIAVGRSNGNSSLGPTTLDVPGRSKPDIVAPARNTSTATSWVSAAASLLIETAGSNSNAARAQTIKAALLAGATKDEFDLDGSTLDTFDDWSHTAGQPLDARYGAGELNVDNSYRILNAGEFENSRSQDVATTGWDFNTIGAGQAKTYFFDVPVNATIDTLSVIATWNREFDVHTQGSSATFDPQLANIDLKLYEASDFNLVKLIDSSTSSIDNVEHLFERGLSGGRYAIKVLSDQQWDYALAWQTTLAEATPGDANFDGEVDGLDYLVWAENFENASATVATGDFNGDQFVDGRDLIIWTDNYTGAPADLYLYSYTEVQKRLAAGGIAIPEPGASLLTAFALIALALGRRRRLVPGR